MAKWSFEPGHTAAEFRARHMMVTYVRGHFKDVHGSLEFDPENPHNSSAEVKIDTRNIWTGVKERDDHLRSADFLDVEHHPEITFKGNQVEINGEHDYAVTGTADGRIASPHHHVISKGGGDRDWILPIFLRANSKRFHHERLYQEIFQDPARRSYDE